MVVYLIKGKEKNYLLTNMQLQEQISLKGNYINIIGTYFLGNESAKKQIEIDEQYDSDNELIVKEK